MATKLDKDITRETNVKINDKEVIITLTANQEVSMKLKGTRGKSVSTPIEGLYNQLTGNIVIKDNDTPKSISVVKQKKVSKTNPMISLYDLRSHNAISTLDLQYKAKFDQIIKSIIDEIKYENKKQS